MSGWVAGAVVVGSVASSYMQSKAAGQAADQYTGQAERGLQYNQEMFNKINEQNAPYRATGERGANLYNQLADARVRNEMAKATSEQEKYNAEVARKNARNAAILGLAGTIGGAALGGPAGAAIGSGIGQGVGGGGLL